MTSSVFAEDFLPPEEAFKAVATWNVESKESSSKIAITVAPAPGYYIYKESLKVRVDKNTNKDLLVYQLPQGKVKFDENFGKKLETYPNPFQITAVLAQSNLANAILEMELQGCAERGICCLLYTSPSPRDYAASRMPSSA